MDMNKRVYIVAIVVSLSVVMLLLHIGRNKTRRQLSMSPDSDAPVTSPQKSRTPSSVAAKQESSLEKNAFATPHEPASPVHSASTLTFTTNGPVSNPSNLEPMIMAFEKEMNGSPEAAALLYRSIAASNSGSTQLAALNRYRFALERMYGASGSMKQHIEALKAKESKDPFDLVFLAQYKTEVDYRQYYATVAADEGSPFAEYAELQKIHYLERRDGEGKDAHRMAVIQNLRNFIAEHPNSAYVPHAKLKIAARLVSAGKKAEASDIYRELLRQNADDKAVCAKCVIALGLMGQHANKEWIRQATDLAMFYGLFGNGYYLREDFDPATADISADGVLASLHSPE